MDVHQIRLKQLADLENLQRIIDENNVLRETYNMLQAQVPPLLDIAEQASVSLNVQNMVYQQEKVYTQEEIESM